MGIIRFAIMNPVKVTVGVILLTLFGLLSIFRIPVQLIPNVDEPQITVSTFWEGASPREIEHEIVERQEEKLKGVSDLKKMTSTSTEGQATVTLQFYVGTDKDVALRNVSDKLRQVSGYPEEVDEPTIEASDAALNSPIAWLIFFAAPGEDPAVLRDFAEDEIKPILERAKGVASVAVYGGREREVQVRVDAALLAARGLTFRDVETALRGQNENSSAGTIASGKRDYTFRTLGQFETLEQVQDTVVANRPGGPVYIRDLASVISTHKKPVSFVRSVGNPVLAMPVRRETGSNVIEVMANLRTQIEMVNTELLAPMNRALRLTQVYDETVYINNAIDLVINNLFFGGLLAVAVLVLFLRSASATAIVALCIPISVIGSFLVVTLLGRTLNVIMLAGMAFAVGMVVDNSIVVLENIYRHLQMGKDRARAALEGAVEVWGAVLASTLTTLAVFLPVIFIEEEAGQLFRDIAIAISSAVGLSLLVAMTVIPAVAAKALKSRKLQPHQQTYGRFAGFLGSVVHYLNGSVLLRSGVGVALIGGSLIGSWLLMAPTDYLPGGNRNLVFGFLVTPPGLSLEEFGRMGSVIEQYISPYWDPQFADYPRLTGEALRKKQALDDAWKREVVPDFEATLTAAERSLQEVRQKYKGRSSNAYRQDARALTELSQAEQALQRVQATADRNPTAAALRAFTDEAPAASSPNTDLKAARRTLAAVRQRYGGRHAADFAERAAAFHELDAAEKAAEKAREDLSSYRIPPPPIRNFFFVSFNGGCFMGGTSRDQDVVRPITNLLTHAGSRVPGTFPIFFQSSLFGEVGGSGNTIELEIRGNDLDQVTQSAEQLQFEIMNRFSYPRSDPSNYNLGRPEVQVVPDRVRAAEVGLNVRDVGQILEACVDGAFVPGGFRDHGDEIDLTLHVQGTQQATPEELAQIPIHTPIGRIVPLGSVVDIIKTTAPQQINHIEEMPSVTLTVRPAEEMALETAMNILEQDIIEPMRSSGRIPDTVFTVAAGNADKLVQTRRALFGAWSGFGWDSAVNLATSRGGLAILITYLLMAALFESFLHPFVIMFTILPATVGGFAGLSLVHHYTLSNPLLATQKLDVLTMLGFVILIGIVVNNAILIVHQALNNMRDGGLEPRDAITLSVRTRIRPIFMTAMTSVVGMAPLVLMGGAGSELYKGLGSVVVGGLLVCTVFTLVLVPTLFSLFVDAAAWIQRRPAAQAVLAPAGRSSP